MKALIVRAAEGPILMIASRPDTVVGELWRGIRLGGEVPDMSNILFQANITTDGGGNDDYGNTRLQKVGIR